MKVEFGFITDKLIFISEKEMIDDRLEIPLEQFSLNYRETKLDYSQLVQLIKFLTKEL
jgi:hypothetical protein